jgi:hypothetical protein
LKYEIHVIKKQVAEKWMRVGSVLQLKEIEVYAN